MIFACTRIIYIILDIINNILDIDPIPYKGMGLSISITKSIGSLQRTEYRSQGYYTLQALGIYHISSLKHKATGWNGTPFGVNSAYCTVTFLPINCSGLLAT